MKEIEFAEWLAENHYVLVNVDIDRVFIWKNEIGKKTTKQLYNEFEEEKTRPNTSSTIECFNKLDKLNQ